MKSAMMRRLFVSVILGSVIVSTTALAADALKLARLTYRQRSLANGLTVLSIENHQSPTVAIQVWYHVGGKDDPVGRSGFAHLFEHLMFKSTKNQPAENFDRITEGVGGNNNAFTREDVTVYFEAVPSNYAEELLWAEADRLANLSVGNGDFISERLVVEEEFRQSILARPYGRLELALETNSWVAHPYKRGVIGSIENLDAATIEDVRKFHATYYRPDNATLIVSGDIDPARVDGWVDKYFGRIAKPAATAIPRVTVKEPARSKEARFHTTGPNVPLPATAINYLVPPRRSDDTDALRVAEAILFRGESSRMNQSLVYRQQIASEVSGGADLRDDASLFTMTVTTAGGKSADDAEKGALAEIDKLKTEPVTSAELEKAQNMLVSEVLQARETALGQAFALGEAAVSFGDPERVNTDVSRLQAVTAADVERVASKYFTTENRVVIRYENGQEEQGGKSKAPQPAPQAVEAAFTPQETAPAPAAPRPVTFPTPIERKLPNGLRVVVIPRAGTGLISVAASVKAGSVFDPNDEAGLADFTASLLTRGTKSHTAPQIAETIEGLGGTITSAAGWDSANVSMLSLSSRLGDALSMFAEVVRSPGFADEEVERLRSEKMDELTVSLRSPRTLANMTAARVIFGDSSYGHSPTGTTETMKALKGAAIRQFYGARYEPQETALVFGGDITPDAAFAYAAQYFGDWKSTGAPKLPMPAVRTSQTGGRVVVIDKPDAGQSAVCVACATIRRGDRQYAIARVANSVLGEGYSARMNQEIRIKRGLSYGASSRLDLRKEGGFFLAAAQTRNDAAAEVAALLKKEMTRLAAEPVAEAELTPRKAALSGNYARQLEKGSGLVATVASLTAEDLPLSSLNDYLPRVEQVTAEEIKSFAAKSLGVGDSSVIIVGDGRQFLAELRKALPNTEVIPVEKLDLNAARLAKP
jgi:zinc protease